MSIMDALSRRATTTAEQYAIVSAYNSATGQAVETEVIQSLGKCIFWEGGASKILISDSMRERVSAVACFKPSVQITGGRIRINGKKDYSIIGQDDIANQGKMKVVYLGEIA